MKIYLVFGIIFNEEHDLLGVYDNLKQAHERCEKEDALSYDKASIQVYLLNNDIRQC